MAVDKEDRAADAAKLWYGLITKFQTPEMVVSSTPRPRAGKWQRVSEREGQLVASSGLLLLWGECRDRHLFLSFSLALHFFREHSMLLFDRLDFN